jgi:hypothetical protein
MSGKKKSLKGKGSYKAYKEQSRFAKNQAAKRARHAKRNPNDLQSVENAKTGYKRKKPMKKNATVSRPKYYDGAGRRVPAPLFQPLTPKETI